jgi:hypothetical protein
MNLSTFCVPGGLFVLDRKWVGFVLALLGLSLVAPVQAGVITVAGTANIFAAGLSSTPAGGGTLPPSIALPGSAQSLTFNSVTGAVNFWTGVAADNGPEGVSIPVFQGTNVVGYPNTGISGIEFDGRQMFLTGVFLGPTNPVTAPAGIAYTTASTNAASFSPLLGQVFFIGDGLANGSTTQQFFVPTGATRIFFGFADGVPGFGTPSAPASPAAYGDNSGTLSLDYNVITPEPLSFFLVGAGVAALALLRRRLV